MPLVVYKTKFKAYWDIEEKFYQFYEFISNDIAKSLYHSDNEFIELENYVLNKQAKFRRAMSEYDIHGRSSPSAKKRGKAKAASIERS